MIGHLSWAEMKAKLDSSEVEYPAGVITWLTLRPIVGERGKQTNAWVEFHVARILGMKQWTGRQTKKNLPV